MLRFLLFASYLSVVHLAAEKIPPIPQHISKASGYLEVYALPVGQGDCTIIQCPNGNLVINDCGSTRGDKGPKLSASEVHAFLKYRLDDIVAIIISHGDEDHFSYLPTITNSQNQNIKRVMIGGILGDYSKISKWLNDFGAKVSTMNGGSPCYSPNCIDHKDINFCNNQNIKFEILAANIGTTKNERSIVLKVTSGSSFSILLPGDMEHHAAEKIAKYFKNNELESFVYKIAHHGASTKANKEAWLAPIKPQRAFASSAYRSNCRHPRCETINRIQNLHTITTADKAHELHCWKNKDTSATRYSTFKGHIYETSPTHNTICMLTYIADRYNNFHQNCNVFGKDFINEVSATSCQGEEDNNGECCSGDTSNGGWWKSVWSFFFGSYNHDEH